MIHIPSLLILLGVYALVSAYLYIARTFTRAGEMEIDEQRAKQFRLATQKRETAAEVSAIPHPARA